MKLFKGDRFVGIAINNLRFIFEDYGRFRKEIDVSLYGARKGTKTIGILGRVKLWVADKTIVEYKKETIVNLINALKEKDEEKPKQN
jgi:hypothetical protein